VLALAEQLDPGLTVTSAPAAASSGELVVAEAVEQADATQVGKAHCPTLGDAVARANA
jgi:hypothetical protein